MRRFLGAMVAVVFAGCPAFADDPKAMAIVDKGIKAIGGEERLSKIGAYSWTSVGKIVMNGPNGQSRGGSVYHWTVQGLDHARFEYFAKANSKSGRGVGVINGNKGWSKRENSPTRPLQEAIVAAHKLRDYLEIIPFSLAPLKGPGFKIEADSEESGKDDAPAVLKVTGPDGTDFRLFFDKQSGLPVKMTTSLKRQGQELHRETTYGDYKDFGGLKKATKIVMTMVADSGLATTDEQEISEFKVLDTLDADTFAEPK